jgi:hypothetical protein
MRGKGKGVIKGSLERTKYTGKVFTTGDRDTVRIFAWGASEQEPGSRGHQGGSSLGPTRNKKSGC